MNETTIEKVQPNIEDMIYEIRGYQVMLDNDVALLFGYEAKQINRQVQRNIERFPKNYCFQLTEEEYKSLRCHFGTLKNGRGEHRKYLPFVFTEHGITMLAGILKSKIAVTMSLKIVDAFIEMRKYISNTLIDQKYINELVLKDNKRIDLLEEIFKKLEKTEVNNHIFFEGQIFDAYSLLIDILREAKENIILIDNYIDKKILDITSKMKVPVYVITNHFSELDIEKYKKQYKNLHITKSTSFHDRFIILDRKILYHCGASFKDLGKKCFAINKIKEKRYLEELLNYQEQCEN